MLLIGCSAEVTEEEQTPTADEQAPTEENNDPITEDTPTNEGEIVEVTPEEPIADEESSWLDDVLIDINSGEEFTIGGNDVPVILESFAVWCPTCTKQQRVIKNLHEQEGDSIISISLDTDPNEDAEKVKKHTEDNGFDWYYAISPRETTQKLIDEFGIGIVSAPSVPTLVVCPNGVFEKLKSGVKSTETLLSEVERLC